MKYFTLLAIVIVVVSAERVSYEGYKVFDVTPTTHRHADILKDFKQSELYDFWTNIKLLRQPVRIMVKPDLQDEFVKTLNTNGMNYNVSIQNAESVFQAEREKQARAPKIQKGRISFDQYHRYDAIVDYILTLASNYPDKVQVDTFGVSYEGRGMYYVKVGDNSENPTIVMDAVIHAREWIASSMALYIIQQLVENPEYNYLSERVNWVVVPLLNPDGYEYSHQVNRMWRKTRSTGELCYGVDGNRNFGYMWGGLGTSDNECSDIYRGPYAFSEPETASFRDLVESLTNVKLYYAIHSFGHWILYPWGYDFLLTDNNEELQELGEMMAEAIYDVNGAYYTVGNAAYLLYPAAGASDDWMKAVGGSELSFTLELPGGGEQGFDLPPEKIQESVTEMWEGVKVGYKYIIGEIQNK